MPPLIWQLLDARTFSGIEKHVEVLCEGLTPLGLDVQITLLTPFEEHPFAERLNANGLKFKVLAGGFLNLLKAIKRDRPSLVHTHGYKAGIFGRVVGQLTNTPTLSTFHAGERGKFPVSLYQDLDEKTAFLAKERFAVSKAIQTSVKNSILLKNAVPVPAQFIPNNPSNIVAFVGRLSHEKAPDIFCEAAKILHGQGLEFHVFGDGVMRQELEAAYAPFVTFKGFTNSMQNEWSKIGLLCMPSRAEGLPMAALEAMAAGVPLAVSNVGELPTLVNLSKAFSFSSDNVQDCVKAITQWKTHENKHILSLNAYNAVFESYNSSKELQILKAYYDNYLWR